MSRLLQLEHEYDQITTVQDLTSVFETIASIRVAHIRDKVVSSTTFFTELWQIYRQLRIDQKDSIGRRPTAEPGSFALIAITSDGGLIGDIDERIIKALLRDERSKDADIFVLGLHGINLLHQGDVRAKQAFALPDMEQAEADVGPIAQMVGAYEKATVYYQQYISLSHQAVAQLDLFSAVAVLGQDQQDQQVEVISSHDYLFEPSLLETITYMESAMLEIALGQVILESKLAQHASRFNAMSAAKHKAKLLQHTVNMELHQIKRSAEDEQMKGILSTMRLLRRRQLA